MRWILSVLMAVFLWAAGQQGAQKRIADDAIRCPWSELRGVDNLCVWEGMGGSATCLAPQGGKLRQYYRRGIVYATSSCEEYYAAIEAAFHRRRQLPVHEREGGLFEPSVVWQCWYDDPCSCEQERS